MLSIIDAKMEFIVLKSLWISSIENPCITSTVAIPKSRLMWAFMPNNKCCITSDVFSETASKATCHELVFAYRQSMNKMHPGSGIQMSHPGVPFSPRLQNLYY